MGRRREQEMRAEKERERERRAVKVGSLTKGARPRTLQTVEKALGMSLAKCFLLGSVCMLVLPFYADIITDVKALQTFQGKKQCTYFSINSSAMVVGALMGAMLLYNETQLIIVALASACQ